MFDVSLFSQMEKSETIVYFNDSLDVSCLKLLYDNCVRMGSESNTNVTIATAHPDLWFGWGYARIKIFTHAIKGLAESDFILAAKIDQISNA